LNWNDSFMPISFSLSIFSKSLHCTQYTSPQRCQKWERKEKGMTKQWDWELYSYNIFMWWEASHVSVSNKSMDINR
jgi:hypothetical protein